MERYITTVNPDWFATFTYCDNVGKVDKVDIFEHPYGEHYNPYHGFSVTFVNLNSRHNDLSEADWEIERAINAFTSYELGSNPYYEPVNIAHFGTGYALRHIMRIRPDIVYCGFLSHPTYSQGYYHEVFAYMTKEQCEAIGIDPDNSDEAREYVHTHFNDYANWANGEIYYAQNGTDSATIISDDLDTIRATVEREFDLKPTDLVSSETRYY